MKNKLLLQLILCFAISLINFSSCTTSGSNTSNSSPFFIVQCLSQNKIRIKAMGNFPNVSPPSPYTYQFSLVDLFKPNISVSINRPNSSGFLENTIGNQTTIFNGNNTLAQSNGGNLNSYDVLFISEGNPASSLLAGGGISGFVDLHLTYPNNLSLDQVLQDCNSTNDVKWGLPGTPVDNMGTWEIWCDCPCE